MSLCLLCVSSCLEFRRTSSLSLILITASFAEAAQAEKFYSDFLNTSDAEAEMRGQESPAKRLRKTKKAKLDTPRESDSDDEGRLALCNVSNE